ncbi:MAG: FlgD Ig-like domain, partial [Bacteroidota bacterium]
ERTTDTITFFPNPFDKSVTIRKGDNVIGDRIIIRDLLGRQVKDLFFTGDEMVWDGTDATGLQAPVGIYLISLLRDGKIIASDKIVRATK